MTRSEFGRGRSRSVKIIEATLGFDTEISKLTFAKESGGALLAA